MARSHQNELQRVSSQLDLSTEKLQKVQEEDIKLRQLQMRIDELQADLERTTGDIEERDRIIQEERSHNEHLKEEQTQLTLHFEQHQQQLRTKSQLDSKDIQEKGARLTEGLCHP